MLHVKLDFLLP